MSNIATNNDAAANAALEAAANSGTPAAVSYSITEDALKKAVTDFFSKNSQLEWSQRNGAIALAYVMKEVGIIPEEMFKPMAKFLTQDTLHGLVGNASQFRQWFYGKENVKKKTIDLDELAG